MPIDAGIYGNLLRSPKTVQEYDAEAQQAKASQLQNALGQIQYSNALRQQQDDQAYREAAKGFGSDTNANASALFSKGLVKEGLAYQKSALDALKTTTDINKDQATADKTSYELRIQKANEAVKDISSLMSPQQARDSISRHMKAGDITFEQASQMLATVPDDMGDFGRWRNQTVMRILDAKTRLEMSMAKPEKFDNGGQIITRDMNPNSPTYGQNTGGAPIVKVQSPDSRASIAATIRGQDKADARAREANQIKREEVAAGGKPPPGYRWNPDGSLSAIPGGPGDKLPEAQQKQVIGTQNLSNAINEYRQALKSFGSLDALNPDQRAMMGTKYNNMMLQAKEAYNLGVLNGPDFDILQSVVTDPRSINGVITSKDALDTQAAELNRIMSGVAQTSSQLKPRGGAAPHVSNPQRTVTRTGTHNGKKVIQYSDGSIEYAN